MFNVSRVILLWLLYRGAVCKYNYTKGGTRPYRIPSPFVVILTPSEVYDYGGVPRPDTIGTYVGGFNADRNQFIILTSLYSVLDPFAELRTARQDILTAVQLKYDFTSIGRKEDTKLGIGVIQLDSSRGTWNPKPIHFELEKQTFLEHLQRGSLSETQGFAMAVATSPALLYSVTWDQRNCPSLYAQMKSDRDWPDVLPEGTFCVFRGRRNVPIVIEDVYYVISPATPCDDTVGSPVLLEDFRTLLGIIIKPFCGHPEVAFAMSPAYLPTVIVPTPSVPTVPPTTTTTTEPPPPLPRVPVTSMPCSGSSRCCLSSIISQSLTLWSLTLFIRMSCAGSRLSEWR